MNIYKLSLGTDFFNDEAYQELTTQNLVCVHPTTSSIGKSSLTQGDAFLNADKGSLFFICRSNESIEQIGMFIDKRPMYSQLEWKSDWTSREFVSIAKAKNPQGYDKKLKRWWTPSFRSTFHEVPKNEISLFEEKFLVPVFDIDYNTLVKKRNLILDKHTLSIEKCKTIQEYFFQLKKDKSKLFEEINNLSSFEIRKLQYEYSLRNDIEQHPVVHLRYKVLQNLTSEIKINSPLIDELKTTIAKSYEKDVFRAWSDPFRILYTHLFAKYKYDLESFLSALIKRIQKDLNIEHATTSKLVHIDGPQNQGHDKIWFAIYNKMFKTQKLAKQLFFKIHNGFEYGLLDFQNKSKNILHKVETFNYDKLLNVFENHKNTILKDNSKEKSKLAALADLLESKKQIILQGPPGTGKTYLAKQLAKVLTGDEEQRKLVQFHPSYTYEDFVRGISAASNAEGELVYESRNKILAKFAEKAMENIQDTQKDIQELSEEEHIEELLLQYAEDVANQLAEKGPHRITDAVSIVEVEEDAFRYTGSNWKNSSRMKFNDLILAQRQKATTRQGFLKIDGISGLAKQHASYFIKVLNQFQAKFEEELAKPIEKEAKKPQDKAYVLIIDEINRANLPSVLGELIYALEYRGEAVESMYAVDGDNQITLPENLYIIGTMNTADRSVGHIDYAIKRRFAFVEILPNAEVITHSKAKELFNRVAALFVQEGENGKENSEYLAPDFRYQDVQLGHSYFILENGTDEELKMRLEYEILPILSEYLKDGVLLESAADYINQKIKGFV